MTESSRAFALSHEQERLRDQVRDFAGREVAPHAADVDERERFPDEAFTAMAAQGLHAPTVGAEYGGRGLDAVATCLVVEEIAKADASAALVPVVHRLGTLPLTTSGSAQLRDQVLPSVMAGEPIAYALSERDAGSDVAAMTTHARQVGDDWVLDGVKSWVTHAGVASWFLVFAVTDPDAERRASAISAFVVHRDDPGLSVDTAERTMGLRGATMADVTFRSCVVPGGRLVGQRGAGLPTALATLDHTRPLAGALAVGVAAAALTTAVSYVRERRQFGRAVADFQGVQFMLAEMGTRLAAARHLVYASAAASERGDADRGYLAAAAKTFASDTAAAVTADAVQLLGGAGYTRNLPAERMMRDAKATQIVEGTNQIQKLVMSRALLAN